MAGQLSEAELRLLGEEPEQEPPPVSILPPDFTQTPYVPKE